jgi:hypothetical protein
MYSWKSRWRVMDAFGCSHIGNHRAVEGALCPAQHVSAEYEVSSELRFAKHVERCGRCGRSHWLPDEGSEGRVEVGEVFGQPEDLVDFDMADDLDVGGFDAGPAGELGLWNSRDCHARLRIIRAR